MGKIIVIDGLDGCGKYTQSKLLLERLKEKTADAVYQLSFPRYGETSSALVDLYLHGHICKNPVDVNAYAASSFYALDRYISYQRQWKEWYEKEDSIIIFDRYTTSNVLHQTPKVDESEKEKFVDWVYNYEYNILGLPKPDIEFYLSLPTESSVNLMQSRQLKNSAEIDIHENKSFQGLCHECFDSLKNSKLTSLNIINCCDDDGVIKSKESINNNIIDILQINNIIY